MPRVQPLLEKSFVSLIQTLCYDQEIIETAHTCHVVLHTGFLLSWFPETVSASKRIYFWIIVWQGSFRKSRCFNLDTMVSFFQSPAWNWINVKIYQGKRVTSGHEPTLTMTHGWPLPITGYDQRIVWYGSLWRNRDGWVEWTVVALCICNQSGNAGIYQCKGSGVAWMWWLDCVLVKVKGQAWLFIQYGIPKGWLRCCCLHFVESREWNKIEWWFSSWWDEGVFLRSFLLFDDNWRFFKSRHRIWKCDDQVGFCAGSKFWNRQNKFN